MWRKWTINPTFCLRSENHSHFLQEELPASEINLTLGSNFTELELGYKTISYTLGILFFHEPHLVMVFFLKSVSVGFYYASFPI